MRSLIFNKYNQIGHHSKVRTTSPFLHPHYLIISLSHYLLRRSAFGVLFFMYSYSFRSPRWPLLSNIPIAYSLAKVSDIEGQLRVQPRTLWRIWASVISDSLSFGRLEPQKATNTPMLKVQKEINWRMRSRASNIYFSVFRLTGVTANSVWGWIVWRGWAWELRIVSTLCQHSPRRQRRCRQPLTPPLSFNSYLKPLFRLFDFSCTTKHPRKSSTFYLRVSLQSHAQLCLSKRQRSLGLFMVSESFSALLFSDCCFSKESTSVSVSDFRILFPQNSFLHSASRKAPFWRTAAL